jgi:hypothetical protein
LPRIWLLQGLTNWSQIRAYNEDEAEIRFGEAKAGNRRAALRPPSLARKSMRSRHEQKALDIVAGRNGQAPAAQASRMSPIVFVSIGLWVAAIACIGGLVAVYFYQSH